MKNLLDMEADDRRPRHRLGEAATTDHLRIQQLPRCTPENPSLISEQKVNPHHVTSLSPEP